jgi:hypothetical protein
MFGRLVLLMAGFLLLAGGGPVAAWVPAPRDALDIQLTTPFQLQLQRKGGVVALGLDDTSINRLQALKTRGVRTICVVNAGAWENWRPDAGAFDQRLIGASYAGWRGERWLDIRAQDALRPLLTRRLDLCRSKGFDGVLYRNVDGYAHRTGFPLTAADQLAYNRWLAAEAHSRDLAVGGMNALELAPELVKVVDFVVSEGCFEADACQALLEYRRADKAAYVVEYTNVRRKMDAYCTAAAELDLQLIFKAKSLNGKIHRRCP